MASGKDAVRIYLLIAVLLDKIQRSLENTRTM